MSFLTSWMNDEYINDDGRFSELFICCYLYTFVFFNLYFYIDVWFIEF